MYFDKFYIIIRVMPHFIFILGRYMRCIQSIAVYLLCIIAYYIVRIHLSTNVYINQQRIFFHIFASIRLLFEVYQILYSMFIFLSYFIILHFFYLGHIMTSDCRDDRDIKKQFRRQNAVGNMLVRKFSFASMEAKIQLFKSYYYPIYGCALWRHSFRTLLENLLSVIVTHSSV